MPHPDFDLIVAGATPAGICAAIADARRGLQVALVDPLPEPGQALSNGISVLDTSSGQGVNGILKEFANRVAEYNRAHFGHLDYFKMNVGAPRHGVADGYSFEPKAAATVFRQMIAAETRLRYYPRHELTGAIMDGKRCIGIRARRIEGQGFDPRWASRDDSPELAPLAVEFRGVAIIDATYEGDIAADAGVPFRVGREARSRLEPHNGITMSDYRTGRVALDAGWLPETFLPGSTGEADSKVMSYNVRYIVKNYGRKEGPHRLKRPENYDPSRFRGSWGLTSDGRDTNQWTLPNGKKFVNALNGGNDMQGELLSTYPNGSRAQRRKVIEAIYDRARQHLYFLQNEMHNEEWGLADDEFLENGCWPYCIYVREARHIVGLKTMTESDIHRWLPRPEDNIFDGIPGDRSRPPLQRDSIAVGDYDLDSRPCADEPTRNYEASGEGGFMLSSIRSPFQVPFGCLVPREVGGLLVTCALSVSHVAHCVVRMEPVWAQVGEAAGIAAALAVRKERPFQELDPKEVQQGLLESGCQLFYYTDVATEHPAFAAIQRLTLRGAARGYPDWSFRPDRLITRGEWAQMLVAALDLAPSVTANHFDDVPHSHSAFVAIETLYDLGARLGRPLVEFERLQKIYCDDNLGYRVYVRPDADIPAREALRTLMVAANCSEDSIFRVAPFLRDAGPWLTRGEAAQLLDALPGMIRN